MQNITFQQYEKICIRLTHNRFEKIIQGVKMTWRNSSNNKTFGSKSSNPKGKTLLTATRGLREPDSLTWLLVSICLFEKLEE